MTEADSTVALVQAIVANAQRLGLVWNLQYATVTSILDLPKVSVKFDGPDNSNEAPVDAIALVGGLVVNGRVAVMTVPPSGQYIISTAIGSAAGDSSWKIPTLINSWVDYDGTVWQSARYRKLSNGMVTIQGLVKNGTGPGVPSGNIFVLPSGYRPAKNLIFATVANNAFGRVDVYADGNVNWSAGGTNGFVSISVSFFAGP